MSALMYLNFAVEILKLLGFSIYLLLEKAVRIFIWRVPKSFKGEVVLVTGGASGIGRDYCLQLVKTELDVTIIVWDVNEGNLKAVVKELEALGVKRALGFKVDVSDREEVREGAKKIRAEVGEVTMLFNNAGIADEPGLGWVSSSRSVERTIAVNLLSYCWTLQEFLPAMIRKGRGHVVETCSLYGLVTGHSGAAYCASKHGLKAYAECIKGDLRKLPEKPEIHFTLVYPHITATPLTAKHKISSAKFPFLVRPYESSYVALRVLKGVALNEEHIAFPRSFIFLPVLFGLVPSAIANRFVDMLDVECTSD